MGTYGDDIFGFLQSNRLFADAVEIITTKDSLAPGFGTNLPPFGSARETATLMHDCNDENKLRLDIWMIGSFAVLILWIVMSFVSSLFTFESLSLLAVWIEGRGSNNANAKIMV